VFVVGSRYQIYLLGPIQIEKDGQSFQAVRSWKGLALLAYLCQQRQPVSRSRLVGIFWPDKTESVGRRNLNRELSELAGQLPGCIQSDYYKVQFKPGADYWLDTWSFQALVSGFKINPPGLDLALFAQSEPHPLEPEVDLVRLAGAVDLYRGDFMAGHYLDDCPDFESWLLREQEIWRQQVTQLLERLAAAYIGRRQDEPAELYLRRWLALAPWNEEAHCYLMLLLARNGRRSAALHQYEHCRQALARELDAAPSARTSWLYQQVKNGMLESWPAGAKKEIASPTSTNLPELLAPFVGRAEELTQLESYLQTPSCRLVTITGMGGTGKSWLALQAAAAATAAFADGVYFVPLVGVAGSDQAGHPGLEDVQQRLIMAISGAIGLELAGSASPLKQLGDYLRSKQLLLLFDNFEHLLAGASLAGELLQLAPQLKILVTSRERLTLLGEWILALEGLDYPPLPAPEPDWGRPEPPPAEERWRTPAGLEQLAAYSAVQLLSQRTRQIKPDFRLTPANGPAIARLCQLVEGMPLAIELIAAQLNTFSPADLVAAITTNLDHLSAAWANLPGRQRSLRVTFEYSWSRLKPAEQASLAGLSVFRSGFSLAAAQAVAGADWEQLLTLVNKSLVRPGLTYRFELHELLRQFAAEKLAGLAGDEAVQARHSAYYLNFLQKQETTLYGPEPQQAITDLRPELENIRQAWTWAAAGRDDWLAPSLAGLARFYEISGFIREGALTFNRAIDLFQIPLAKEGRQDPDAPSRVALLGWLLAHEAHFCDLIGRFDRAVALAQQAITLAQQIPSSALEAYGLIVWGSSRAKQGKYNEARQVLEPALALARTAGAARLEVLCLLNLGRAQDMNSDVLEQAGQLAHQLGDHWLECQILNELGGVAVSQSRWDQARRYWQQALQYTLALNNPYRAATLQNNLGDVYRQLGDFERAMIYQEALLTCRRTGNRGLESSVLEGLARLSFMRGNHQTAWGYLQAGLVLSQELEMVNNQAWLYNILGHMMMTQQAYDAARTAYGRAIHCSQQSQPGVAMESRAGLAQLYLAQDDLPAAQAQVESILAFLERGGKLDSYTAMMVYLACYRSLQALQDPRAPQILATAYHLLQEQAGAIEDEVLRRLFLENIPAHRDILALASKTGSISRP
jgi:predicted ATPase/DNA-binding SARP family transcriptional activator